MTALNPQPATQTQPGSCINIGKTAGYVPFVSVLGLPVGAFFTPEKARRMIPLLDREAICAAPTPPPLTELRTLILDKTGQPLAGSHLDRRAYCSSALAAGDVLT